MLLTVGRVVRPHGVRGEVVVEVRTDEPEQRYAEGAVLLAERESPGTSGSPGPPESPGPVGAPGRPGPPAALDRKSTRLNSSHVKSSYAVLCLNRARLNQ